MLTHLRILTKARRRFETLSAAPAALQFKDFVQGGTASDNQVANFSPSFPVRIKYPSRNWIGSP